MREKRERIRCEEIQLTHLRFCMVRVTGLRVDGGDVTAFVVDDVVAAKLERERNGWERART